MLHPIADALSARGVPFISASGYEASLMPTVYAHVPRVGKPIDSATIARFFSRRRLIIGEPNSSA